MAVPTLLYGPECWILTKQRESQIEAGEMRFLKAVEDYRRRNHIGNHTVIQELNIFNIADRIVEYQMSWFHQLERRDESRFAKRFLLG
jgi:hypothetical protein